MGLRFRKSFKIAPGVKLNLNKNSTSVTFGKRGAHYTVNSKGKKTASVGIPGTGISYVQSKGGSTSSKKTTKRKGTTMSQNNFKNSGPGKKWYQKTGWIIILLILFFPVGLFLMWKYTDWKKPIKWIITVFILIFALVGLAFPSSLEGINLSADTDTTYDINQKVEISASTTPDDYELSKDDFQCSDGKLKVSGKTVVFTASKAGSYKVWAEHDGVKSNKLSIKIEDKEAIAKKEDEEKAKAEKLAEEKAKQEAEAKAQAEAEAAAQAQAEAEAQAAAQAQAEADAQATAQAQAANDPIVYITDTGGKYHRDGCRFLKQSKIETHLSEVQGVYGPCGVCNPPQ